MGKGSTIIPNEVGVFKLKFEGGEGIRQKAICERSVLEIPCKGPKFGSMPDDFQEE